MDPFAPGASPRMSANRYGPSSGPPMRRVSVTASCAEAVRATARAIRQLPARIHLERVRDALAPFQLASPNDPGRRHKWAFPMRMVGTALAESPTTAGLRPATWTRFRERVLGSGQKSDSAGNHAPHRGAGGRMHGQRRVGKALLDLEAVNRLVRRRANGFVEIRRHDAGRSKALRFTLPATRVRAQPGKSRVSAIRRGPTSSSARTPPRPRAAGRCQRATSSAPRHRR